MNHIFKMVKLITSRALIKQQEKIACLEKKMTELEQGVGAATSQGHETWHDNAGFDIAVHEVRIHDVRLSDAYRVLDEAKLAEYPHKVGTDVSYGTRVIFLRDGKRMDIQIVGYCDANPDRDRILYESPLAKALYDHHIGEVFNVPINGILSNFKIEQVLPITDTDLLE